MEQEKKEMQNCKNQHRKNNNGELISQSRRKALKTIAAGTAVAGTIALTGKWSKPVVNAIILPAHAQATNATEPTTTPTPTTTGECSPLIEAACYTTTLDMQTEYVISATVIGNVNPAQSGAAITVQINPSVDGGPERTDTLQTNTDQNGAFSVTKTYTVADRIMRINTPSATGPCNSVDVPECAL